MAVAPEHTGGRVGFVDARMSPFQRRRAGDTPGSPADDAKEVPGPQADMPAL